MSFIECTVLAFDRAQQVAAGAASAGSPQGSRPARRGVRSGGGAVAERWALVAHSGASRRAPIDARPTHAPRSRPRRAPPPRCALLPDTSPSAGSGRALRHSAAPPAELLHCPPNWGAGGGGYVTSCQNMLKVVLVLAPSLSVTFCC